MNLSTHAVLLPVLLPLVSAALLVVLPDRFRLLKAGLHLLTMLASLAVAVVLLLGLDSGTTNGTKVYLPGNWPVPFGIVLVLDRLSAMMLVMAALAGVGSLLFALARWHRASVHFHPLLQLQLAGLNGAFLTGDLFNLFVFFEVLLAASYGLLLHGGGSLRVRAGLHYIAINLLASLLFLIGAALLYGVTGTLTMADIAQKLPLVPPADRGLLHAAAALLAVAFLAKAAFWPLNFWLPSAYAAASAPAAAMFAILTKVGVYAILRLWTLCFPATAGDSALFGSGVLVWGGLATITFGSLGMLRSLQLSRVAGYSVITSSGTVIAAAGFDQPALTTGALFYLASSTLGAAALFLLVELVERQRQVEVDPPAPDDVVGRLPAFTEEKAAADANLDDEQGLLVGRALPGALAFLGVAFFTCMLVIAGLPPLSGFVGKLAMLQALAAGAATGTSGSAAWVMFGLLLFSGLLSTVALSRAFITHFWATQDRAAPRLRVIEGVPIVLLLGASIALAVGGERALGYARAAADGLHAPQGYIDAVMTTQPRAAPR
ncbi:monovalent cation/H+ antiporter subunit D [Caenimonas sedimenti]|uniref:Monovalent cation/H+ antiporter subunit D n=1 Tax=Caenimonas sedimenti TaxID=2596921 RepID=A0A562ZJM0_9BURK|nr:monovalent cation/H+ antiporter subunit D [Caenimonas sedimenti]TWO68515.1 monovalent cation/H+ antiporter subunit D [Caenimonas sedimenti]